ncbi:MAG: hypothetical protein KDC54_09530 [Lewinella sp.]|nr:hypothetical protein [Lewinella sp.]
MRFHYGVLFLLLLTGPLSRAQQPPDPEQWRADIDFLRRQLPAVHPNWYHRHDEAYWETALDSISRLAGGQSDLATALQLQQAVARMGDSHTRLDFGSFVDTDHCLPVAGYYFADGVFITHAMPPFGHLLGQQWQSINGQPMDTVLQILSGLFTIDNEATYWLKSTQLLSHPDILQALRFFPAKNDSVSIGLRDSLGHDHTIALPLVPLQQFRSTAQLLRPDTLPLAYRDTRRLFWSEYFPADSLYYVQYNKCTSQEVASQNRDRRRPQDLPAFAPFAEEVLQTVREEPIKTFIFDLRHNTGGSSPQGQHLIEALGEVAQLQLPGCTYLILGRSTFSSAVLNAVTFTEVFPEVITIGEPTSGSPTHFGEVRQFNLPRTGLRVWHSTKYFIREPRDATTLEPAFRIPFRFEDYRHGVDAVLDHIHQMANGQ